MKIEEQNKQREFERATATFIQTLEELKTLRSSVEALLPDVHEILLDASRLNEDYLLFTTTHEAKLLVDENSQELERIEEKFHLRNQALESRKEKIIQTLSLINEQQEQKRVVLQDLLRLLVDK